MKKIFKLMMATAIAAFTFTACEDVPEPYNNPYDQRGNGGDEPAEVIEPTGSGTVDDPYNVAAAQKLIEELGADVNSDVIYVKGVINDLGAGVSEQYMNAQFYIADNMNGANQLLVYRSNFLNNEKFTSTDQVKEGDEVIMCGQVVNYKGNTPEFTTGTYIYSINGNTGGGDNPNPDVKTVGTKDAPKTVADALTAIDALAKGATTDEFWFIKGKVKQIKTTADNIVKYKNIDYIITDDGNNELTVFRGKNLDNTDFTSADELKEGDEVVVYGKLTKYENPNTGAIVPEVAQGNYIVSKSDGGSTPVDNKTVGSKDAPKTVADALAAIDKMEDNAVSEEFWFVTGKVVKVTTNQDNFEKYGNLNYLISADGTENNTITVYSGDGLDGAKFSGIDALKEGDEVVVYGQLQKYVKNDKVTPEIAKGNYLVSLKSGGDTPNPPTPDGGTGTLDKPLSASQAYDIVAAMEAGVVSSEDYYVKGKIVSIKYTFSAQYGTATFNISD
nr:hypothetical protein [Prevotella sp.]